MPERNKTLLATGATALVLATPMASHAGPAWDGTDGVSLARSRQNPLTERQTHSLDAGR